ncbi:MAG: hypothetical protein K6C69_03045 [Lachnospiraceae bacterium]|nr:hypothetical protein [Lachnospiraceae bacterium]
MKSVFQATQGTKSRNKKSEEKANGWLGERKSTPSHPMHQKSQYPKVKKKSLNTYYLAMR